jgi:starch phosphorylase
MVSGVDLWLNNPIRPYEASGTSGMKAALNGVPNCSILDGWWAEGYNGSNGWAIGEEREYQDQETQNEADATDLYEELEREIIPTFFDRGADGIPHRWVAVMREAIRSCAGQFSMARQVKQYTEKLYVPTSRRNVDFRGSGYEKARSLASWKQQIASNWHAVALQVEGPRDTQVGMGEPVVVTAQLRLGALRPEDVRVELVVGRDENGDITETGSVELQRQSQSGSGATVYSGNIAAQHGGSLVYGVRVVPFHPDLATKYELGLVRWA